MSRLDAILATVFGLLVSFLDTQILSGPYLGLRGMFLSFFLGALGWLAGTAAVHQLEHSGDRRTKAFQRRLWRVPLALCCAVAVCTVFYFVYVVAGKTAYSTLEIAIHLCILFSLAVAIRIIVYLFKRGR